MRPGVLQLVDTLAIGGTERVALNLANGLPQNRYRMFLATTRADGPLVGSVASHVGRLALMRRRTLDLGAIYRLVRFVRANRIGIIHAHSSSLLTAALAGALLPGVRVVWHVHSGALAERRAGAYRALARRASATIAVNRALSEWCGALGARHVHFIPNAVDLTAFPREASERRDVICVANLRPEKDHPTLLRAWQLVTGQHPEARLMLVGGGASTAYAAELRRLCGELGIAGSVDWLGERGDVAALLAGAAIGVLSSASEGLPLALLEYGAADLAVAATDVGECGAVVDGGRAGLLVAPGDAAGLALALGRLLDDAALRQTLGEALRRRVAAEYGSERMLTRVAAIYDSLCGSEATHVQR